MYEIGKRVFGTQVFKTYDPQVSIDMVPGVTYQAVFDADLTTSGWEDRVYQDLVEECSRHGCELTYFGVCYPNKKIIAQWQYHGPVPGFQSTILPAIPAIGAGAVVMAILGVIGVSIGGVSFFKLSELYEKNPLGIGLVVGGVVLVGALLAFGYVSRSAR